MAEEEGLQAPAGLEPGEAETEAAPELQEEEGKEKMEEGKEKEEEKEEGKEKEEEKEEGKEKEEEKEEGKEKEGPAKASAASLHSEAPEAPEAEAEAESVSAFSSSEVEGEAQAEEAEEKPEEPPPPATPGEPPDGEEEEEAKPQEAEAGAEAAPSEGAEEEEEAAASAAPPARPSSRGTSPLPTSSSFSAGELLEPPLVVGEELGRRTSLSLRDLEKRCLSGGSLRPGSSPESRSSEASGFESEEQRQERLAQERRLREELTEECRRLQAERRRLLIHDAKIQGKLAELLGRVGGREAAPARAELEQHISDREQRYSRYLSLLEELRSQQAAEGAWYRQQLDALQGSCRERLAKVEGEWKGHQALKREVAVFTMGRRLGGRQAAVREVEQIQAREQGKEREMTEVRLEYIKLKHRIQKLEASLKAQEELAEGLHLIDFEQLKIENQTYNEKIEERNEELLKLRRRITNTVQIISPVKEKLQFVEAENQGQKAQLMAVEGLVAQKREILTKTKQARDKMRMDNERLQQKCGLLGHTLLLRDFENKVDASEAWKERLDMLKRRHAGLALTCKRIKISFQYQKMQELQGGG